VFEPHAEAFLGSPFWNAILHRKSNDAEGWRASRFFGPLDWLFHVSAMLWLRWYLHQRAKKIS
jgi:hypothetical protein